MKNLIFPLLVLAIVLTLAAWRPSATGAQLPKAGDSDASDALPKVEQDFNIIGPNEFPKKTFAAIVPPKSVERIILLQDHGLGAKDGVALEPDALFAQLTRSAVVSEDWGLDARERSAAEFLVVTKQDVVYKLTVLSQCLMKAKGGVSGVLLYGKGFSCRFDFRASPLTGDKPE
jgi:hypothetical protein